jgi:GNAT superfamily N-acetyltransferase
MTGPVRRAVAGDGDALADCITAAYARYAGLLLPDVAGGVPQEIADHLVWVFEIDGAIVGGIVVSRAADKAHLRNLAVHPAHGRKGIGSALIKTAIEALAADGVRSVDLATHVGMPENVALYSHLGWVETQRAGDKVFMSRAI